MGTFKMTVSPWPVRARRHELRMPVVPGVVFVDPDHAEVTQRDVRSSARLE
jgi:hypothetical protein